MNHFRGWPAGGDTGRGQSETIGVVLLVALVVVLAAVIGQVVFGLTIVQDGEQEIGPRVSFAETETGGDLVVEHQSGESVTTDQLTVIGSGTGAFTVDWTAQGIGEAWTAGESLTITPQPGETVRIAWESSVTGDSTVILTYEFEG
jgi:flagellin-like protein